MRAVAPLKFNACKDTIMRWLIRDRNEIYFIFFKFIVRSSACAGRGPSQSRHLPHAACAACDLCRPRPAPRAASNGRGPCRTRARHVARRPHPAPALAARRPDPAPALVRACPSCPRRPQLAPRPRILRITNGRDVRPSKFASYIGGGLCRFRLTASDWMPSHCHLFKRSR
jgi:hypothetical protein